MKPLKHDIPSMYDHKQFRKAGFRVNKPLLLISLLALWALFRLLNPTMSWVMTKMELSSHSSTKGVHYTFLNFSNQLSATGKMQDALIHNTKGRVQVVAYYNFLHPATFLVQTPKATGLIPVDLGRVIVMAKPGLSKYTLSLWGSLTLERNGEATASAYIENAPLPMLLAGSGTLSFTAKAPRQSIYLMVPYLFYLLFPLLSILVIASIYSPAVYSAYFYFPLAFLLFDFKELFFRVPFNWLLQNYKDGAPGWLEILVPVIIVILLMMAAISGLYKWRNRRDVFVETLTIFFFLFLPIIFRI